MYSGPSFDELPSSPSPYPSKSLPKKTVPLRPSGSRSQRQRRGATTSSHEPTPPPHQVPHETPARRRIYVSSSRVQAIPFKSTPSTPNRHQALNVPRDTPIARKLEGQHGAFIPNKAQDNNRQHAREGKKVMIGPMPVDDFLMEFMPVPPANYPKPDSTGVFDSVPSDVTSEKEIYDILCKIVNDGSWCPSVKFCVASDIAEDPGLDSYKPDIVGYDEGVLPAVARKGKDNETKYIANLGLAEIFIEVKKGLDPFCEPEKHSHDQASSSAKKSFFACENHERIDDDEPRIEGNIAAIEKCNLGQNIRYASKQCSRQHRMFCFSILVVGTRARFFRWDRAGSIVTRSFDYKERPDLLCEFLWRFGYADPAQRGYDPTVTVASVEEEELFRDLVEEHARFQLAIGPDNTDELNKELDRHYEKGKVTRVEVFNGAQSSSPEVYLVSVPSKSPKSAACRGTRSYWAVKVLGPKQGEVCFLKDTWRVDVDRSEEEGDIYLDLEKKKVINIPDIAIAGDVPNFELVDEFDECVGAVSQDRNISAEDKTAEPDNDDPKALVQVQCTRTDEFINAPWVCECLRKDIDLRITKHTHCRLVLKQAGYPLRRFKGSRELFEAAFDTLKALDSAFLNAGRLHRDVSIDNIILYRFPGAARRTGLLVDWEFSTHADRSGKARDYIRSGTWSFMSLNVLTGGDDFRHSREDDIESLFYVVTYACVRWLTHKLTSGLGRWIADFFDSSEPGENGQDQGGSGKAAVTYRYKQFLRKFNFENKHVQSWFEMAFPHLFTYHAPEGVVTWTSENLRAVFVASCEGFASSDESDMDRVENKVDDYHIPVAEKERSTYSVGLKTSRKVPATSASLRLSGKRPLAEPAEGSSRTNSNGFHGPQERESKRRRPPAPEGLATVDREANEQQPRKRRVSSLRSVRSTHGEPALHDGSSKANVIRPRSRRSTKSTPSLRNHPSVSSSLGKTGLRRSARLSAKQSGSSLRRQT